MQMVIAPFVGFILIDSAVPLLAKIAMEGFAGLAGGLCLARETLD